MSKSSLDPLLEQGGKLVLELANQLMMVDSNPLEGVTKFEGSGVYALYYHGELKYYTKIRNVKPIYIGKSAQEGCRKGKSLMGNTTLYRRLVKHRTTIATVSDLDIRDFSCKYLVLPKLWVPAVEHTLIERHQPPWNCCLDGFGNNDVGKGRHGGEISWWDTLHPGRLWNQNCRAVKTQEEAESRLRNFINNKK